MLLRMDYIENAAATSVVNKVAEMIRVQSFVINIARLEITQCYYYHVFFLFFYFHRLCALMCGWYWEEFWPTVSKIKKFNDWQTEPVFSMLMMLLFREIFVG